ncbi:peptidase M61 [Flavobacterium sp. 102]|uniref:M61 family metallopeptidase n=1 Tax=Flavobacterium sp. 102 TaxID=2135623 RepID=UPI000EAC1A9F|nr:peptidase M61 [Flavobacterium sp. 102]RKS01967.1 putative metalloprotease with PDZ domain [Flavobacterium sp. 102]
MKKLILSAIVTLSVFNFNAVAQKKSTTVQEIKVAIDLNQVKEDKVMVTITPPSFTSAEVVFHIPKTVPGTYFSDNYGKLLVDLKALDKSGNELTVTKTDDNSWKISNAKALAKVTYWVNDTYDTETGRGFGKDEIFSPAGTNIDEGKNFMLNNHGFIGYFDDKLEIPYNVTITHPATLFGSTSLVDLNKSDTVDNFVTKRYFELVDNPIMYSKPDYITFKVDGMEILFSVYSPNGSHTAKSLLADLEKTMRAQKAFLGPINNNKKYTVLLYLSDMQKADAKGFGALEHHTSTTVVFPEMMPAAALGEQIKDVVSHEFFHIVTPLSIHSKEIQYFDYNNPKMSKHLWMYEGVTEYFANLFQINQGLIDSDEFYQRMVGKINNASSLNDTMPFTEMSANVLVPPYKDQYLNVYEKGALIGMCIDIIIREKSNGQRGILDLMQKLSKKYGAEKPFNDEDLFAEITSLTYPEVGEFLNTYVAGPTPIPYDVYFAKVGVGKAKMSVPMNPFLKDQSTPYITVDGKTKEIMVLPSTELNEFMKGLGMQGGDIIVAVNDKAYNLDNIYDMIMESQSWKVDDDITVKIKRDGKEQTIKGKVKLSMEEVEGYGLIDTSKEPLNKAWLKG